MGKYFFYNNGACKNHGCEAIALSTYKILKLHKTEEKYSSYDIEADTKYKLDQYYTLVDNGKNLSFSTVKRVAFYLYRKIFGNNDMQNKYQFGNLTKEVTNEEIAIALGGDNFCYKNATEISFYLNRLIKKRGLKNVLWGCSVDEEAMNDVTGKNTLGMFDLIIARESLTYDLLTSYGVNSNVKLIPDPAFQLDIEDVKLPREFENNNIVGINASDLITNYEFIQGATVKNYLNLIKYILEKTDKKIFLIAHVESDIKVLDILLTHFNSDRIYCIKNTGCKVLKGYISHCETFIGARTHATIAAYSTCVPTLVVGYSIKSKGIAKDIFGTYKNYVISVGDFTDDDTLLKGYLWLDEHKDIIRTHLENFIPSYKEKAFVAKDEVLKLIK